MSIFKLSLKTNELIKLTGLTRANLDNYRTLGILKRTEKSNTWCYQEILFSFLLTELKNNFSNKQITKLALTIRNNGDLTYFALSERLIFSNDGDNDLNFRVAVLGKVFNETSLKGVVTKAENSFIEFDDRENPIILKNATIIDMKKLREKLEKKCFELNFVETLNLVA